MASVDAILGDRPFLSENCPHLYVPFRALHFRDAALVWLNARYWCSMGLDIGDPDTVRDLERQLVARFGVSVPDDVDGVDMHADSSVTLFADRYGGTFGHSHGGSGRAGTLGSFNAKGVGSTPLRDPDASWYHAHGCMWLEEAIREAIFSEVCWHAFPWKANPIVAIIDTGRNLVHQDGEVGARRAVAIRPAALRVSHLERNILFGTAGTPDSDQVQDFRRVAEVISHVRGNGIDPQSGPGAPVLATVVDRICAQVAFGRAHRLFHGDFLSSNVGLTGELIDFGAFRGVTDWRRRNWEQNGLPFGGEARRIFQTVRSLAFHLRKHGGSAADDRLIPVEQLDAAIRSKFIAYLESICGRHPSAALIGARLAEFYDWEQGGLPCEPAAWPILLAGLRAERRDERDHVAYRIGRAVRDDLEAGPGAVRRGAAAALLRWAAPFDYATREAVLIRTTRPFGAIRQKPCVKRVARFISRNVNAIRRSFVSVSEDEEILAKWTSFGLLFLDCRDLRSGQHHWRIEGPSINGDLLVDGGVIPPWPGCRVYDAGAGSIGFVSRSDPRAGLRKVMAGMPASRI